MSAEDNEPTDAKASLRCAETCSRALIGTFILSAAGFAVHAPLEERRFQQAFAAYAAARINLALRIERFDSDPRLQIVRDRLSDTIVDNMRLSQLDEELMRIETEIVTAGMATEGAKTAAAGDLQASNREPARQPEDPPAPAPIAAANGTLLAFATADFVGPLERAMQRFEDKEMLGYARMYSYEANYTIVRWFNRHKALFEFARDPATGRTSIPVTPAVGLLRERVSLAEIKALSSHEEIRPGTLDSEFKRVSIPWVDVALGPEEAAKFIGVSMIVVLAYFWFFAREARVRHLMELKGTLFSAINSGWVTRLAFGAAMAVPVISFGRLVLVHHEGSRLMVACLCAIAILALASISTCLRRHS